MSAKPQNHDLTSREAADWFATMHSGDVPKDVQRAFEDWLHSDIANKHAYRELEQVYRDLDFVAVEVGLGQPAGTSLADRLSASMADAFAWLKRPVVAGGLALACIAMVVSQIPIKLEAPAIDNSVAEQAPEYATKVAEIREVHLSDGSRITLGAKSRIEVSFDETRREVRLLDGEAFFDVTTEPNRPFFVAAQDTLVRVVGTKFDVKRSAEIVHVSVLEGVVEVMKADGAGAISDVVENEQIEKQILTAGERVSAARRVDLPKTRQVDQVEPGAWRQGRLAYEDASLAEIVADLNRYHDRPISIGVAKLGDMRSTIAFSTSEIDQVLAVIEAIHPVEVRRLSSGEIIILED
ncbi:MAG: FecR domain-containing protein [Pseudomonadota bacterium]